MLMRKEGSAGEISIEKTMSIHALRKNLP